MDAKRELLRHTLATLAYRAGKAMRGAPPTFAGFLAPGATRAPAQIVAHMGDLFDWALSIAKSAQAWHDSSPLEWDAEVRRFFNTVAAFDAYLASDAPLGATPEQLFQGPIADALTHTGQLTLLRRLAGATMKSENYFRADIVMGRVGGEQTPPRREF